MKGNIWVVVVAFLFVAFAPAVLVGDSTTLAANLESLYSPLAVLAGLFGFLAAVGAFIRYVFAGGGGF
jgi:hypothetical protein